jgi:uncharacterized protein (TIGR02145 family)
MIKPLFFPTIFLITIFIFFSCNNNITESNTNKPEVTIDKIINITDSSAQCVGRIISNGGATITDCGICWSVNQNPTVTDFKTNENACVDSFTHNIFNLTAETSYYAKAFATNSEGTGYSSSITFKTLPVGMISDIDGNMYKTVKIGNQVWLAENLKVTHYRNGDPIPNVTQNSEWTYRSTGAFCAYNNQGSNAEIYGYLYNWHAVNDSRNIAPFGWHVPNVYEWRILGDYLGGDNVAGGKMKETGTSHWPYPNMEATNESGFTALPGGERAYSGKFYMMGQEGYFCTSTITEFLQPYIRRLYWDSSELIDDITSVQRGHSIRCVRD